MLGLAVLCAPKLRGQELVQQYGHQAGDPGPRALGLVQLSSTGKIKVRLIPIVIMLDGKFYDAGSYKATPVPMALDFGVVYEAFHAGVSQGLFTITQPGQLNHNWIAEGTWLPAGTKPPETKHKYAPPVIDDDKKDNDDRPVLHRRAEGAADKPETGSSGAAKTADTQPATPPASTPPASTPPSPGSTTAPPTSSTPASSAPGGTPTSTTPAPNAPPAPNDTNTNTNKDAPKPQTQSASRTSDLDEPISDPNRPRLRRGKPDASAHHELFVDFDAAEDASAKKDASAPNAANSAANSPTNSKDAPATVQTFAAISDAHGPDQRPYTYDLKPAEEAMYRNKMLELAATLVKLAPRQPASSTSSAASKSAPSAPLARGKSVSAKTARAAKPQFEDVNLRVFDLSNSNEPVLVLSAQTPVPPVGTAGAQVPQEITLVARTTLEGELHKLFFAQTDSHHLDVSPRMELIDAADADGDGRGELLFRQTSDAGSAYAIYRVTADQLWPLYEGTP